MVHWEPPLILNHWGLNFGQEKGGGKKPYTEIEKKRLLEGRRVG